MSNSLTRFIDRNRIGMIITAGIGAGLVFVSHDKWEISKERQVLIRRIAQADVTAQVCPSAKPPTDIVLTMAPLLEMEDHILHKRVEDFLYDTDRQGIRFAFCPLALGTTLFDVVRGVDSSPLTVLKINDAATSQEQQAAIMQFLKEYKLGNVGLYYNAVVRADPELVKAMPGRLAPGTDVKRHDLRQYGHTLQIPHR